MSSEIRGDSSLRERLYLNDMKKISITNRELDYGINVDKVFWVENGIIRREHVRESKDEEIIADILSYTLLKDKPLSSSKSLDEFYGFKSDKSKKYKEIEEQNSFDFKLGFCNLRDRTFRDKTLNKCIKTLTAMVNRGKGSVGYVIVGVADKKCDTEEVHKLTGEEAIKRGNFYITGVNHDIHLLNISDDTYYQQIIQKIELEPIENKYKSLISNKIKFLDYCGRKVIIMKMDEVDAPVLYDDNYYERKGVNNDKVEVKEMMNLIKRFSE